MADVLVRGLSAKVVSQLKVRARRNGRSLQAELQRILQQAASAERGDTVKLAAKIRRQLSNRRHTNSATLVRRGRAR